MAIPLRRSLDELLSSNLTNASSFWQGGTNPVNAVRGLMSDALGVDSSSQTINVSTPDYSSLLTNLFNGLQTSLASSAQSALNAELAAAERQMQYQTAANEKAMQFEAEQAKLIVFFSRTAPIRLCNFLLSRPKRLCSLKLSKVKRLTHSPSVWLTRRISVLLRICKLQV